MQKEGKKIADRTDSSKIPRQLSSMYHQIQIESGLRLDRGSRRWQAAKGHVRHVQPFILFITFIFNIRTTRVRKRKTTTTTDTATAAMPAGIQHQVVQRSRVLDKMPFSSACTTIDKRCTAKRARKMYAAVRQDVRCCTPRCRHRCAVDDDTKRLEKCTPVVYRRLYVDRLTTITAPTAPGTARHQPYSFVRPRHTR